MKNASVDINQVSHALMKSVYTVQLRKHYITPVTAFMRVRTQVDCLATVCILDTIKSIV